MPDQARIIAPARRSYRGSITSPERWSTWIPRTGDILVCTPSKCGTTWTQTILAMLINGGPDLPGKIPVISPWVDADLGVPAEDVGKALDEQSGRRVVKTHTPADGFPIWDGVTVVAVYRHPLDVFFSLREHTANRTTAAADSAMLLPLEESFRKFVEGPADPEDFDRDTLATFIMHYRETALSARLPDLKLFHYSDMIRDGRSAVKALAVAAGVGADATLVEDVAAATAFETMKASAGKYVPVAGTGFWKSDASFFHSASSQKWRGKLSDAQLGLYRERLQELLPDSAARNWLEEGRGA